MKTFMIRLDDIDTAMLVELRKKKSSYRDLGGILSSLIREDYARLPKKPKNA
jgi:hypothetical protein